MIEKVESQKYGSIFSLGTLDKLKKIAYNDYATFIFELKRRYTTIL